MSNQSTNVPFHYCGVTEPICLSSTYFTPPDESKSTWSYPRIDDPNSSIVCEKAKKLYPGSKYALSTPSGVCSISTAIQSCLTMLSLIDGSNINLLLPNELYKDSLQLFSYLIRIHKLELVYYNPLDYDGILELVKKSGPSIFFIETCTNPSSFTVDPKLYTEVKKVNHQIITVVDNSWTGPSLFNPIKYGADILVESTSKCLSGGAIISGIIVTNVEEYHKACQYNLLANGLHVSPFDSWYLSQMIDAVEYRTCQASQKCVTIVKELDKEEFIECIHPCLENHPSHEMVKKYLSGYPNVALIHIKGISKDKVKDYLLKSNIFIAPSYGKSYTMIDPGIKVGKTEMDTYFRLSIGYMDDVQSTVESIVGLNSLISKKSEN